MSFRQKSTPFQIHQGYSIAHAYDSGSIAGWPGEDVAKEQFYLLSSQPNQRTFVQFQLPIQGDGKMMLYACARKVLGADTKNYPQQIGDCVSFGAKNACEHLICVQAALGLAPDKFRPVFPPYLYGCGRVFIGGQHNSYEDGSVGSWQAGAVQKYGVLASDESNVPAYSGNVAREWGAKGPSDAFQTLAKVHLVKSAAQMGSWNDVVAAVTNGYPCTVASNQGFNMEPDSDGFHSARGSWAHQMSIIGVDNKYKTPYAIILNSWGDVHGHLKDFDSGEDLPVGTLRVRAETIERMIKQQDTFAFSHMDWFEEQKLPEDLFKLI
jgi:hypothetical protein